MKVVRKYVNFRLFKGVPIVSILTLYGVSVSIETTKSCHLLLVTPVKSFLNPTFKSYSFMYGL